MIVPVTDVLFCGDFIATNFPIRQSDLESSVGKRQWLMEVVVGFAFTLHDAPRCRSEEGLELNDTTEGLEPHTPGTAQGDSIQ